MKQHLGMTVILKQSHNDFLWLLRAILWFIIHLFFFIVISMFFKIAWLDLLLKKTLRESKSLQKSKKLFQNETILADAYPNIKRCHSLYFKRDTDSESLVGVPQIILEDIKQSSDSQFLYKYSCTFRKFKNC